jgi:hypothetical protein
MGKGLLANCALGRVSFIALCTIALLCCASPGSATSILLSQDADFAVLGADLSNTGFAPVAAKADTPNNSPASGSVGSFGTPAYDAPAGVGGAAHLGNAVGLSADNQLAAAVATLGAMGPDTLESESVEGITVVPGLSTSSFGANMGALGNTLTGASMSGGVGDTNTIQLPGSPIAASGSSVNIIDVGSDGGAALDWNLNSSAADLAAGGGLTGGISATEAAAEVPEPASLLLLGGGLLIAAAKRRKAQRGLSIG